MKNRHTGSTFDSFLEEEGIREEVESVAVKRVLAWQLQKTMQEQHKTKRAMAKDLHTSRSQLDRLLDPTKLSVTLDTINKAAKVLHKGVRLEIVDLDVPGAPGSSRTATAHPSGADHSESRESGHSKKSKTLKARTALA